MVYVDVCRAVYDYAPQSDEELEIKEGDLLFIIEKSSDDDWWRCKKKAASDDEDEPEGLVPNNYVEHLAPAYHAKALYDYSWQTEGELSFKEEARLEVYDDSDPDWTLVGCEGDYGFAPANYIEKAAATAAVSSASAASAAHFALPSIQRDLAPPPMPSRSRAVEGPIAGESDYPDPGLAPTPSPEPTQYNPAAGLAAIIAQRTGGGQPSSTVDRGMISPPLQPRPQYTPDESEDEGPPPPMPQRPISQTVPSPAPTQYAPPRVSEPPANRQISSYAPAGFTPPDDEGTHDTRPLRSPGGSFHLYNVHEMISHMGKSKKMPTTLGINIARGVVMISPEKSRDGPSQEWTAEKLTHYSIEGKHVFVELVRPSKSVDFHAGAKDTAQEIVAMLGELAGWQRGEGLKEVLAASAGTGAGGQKKGKMLYEFMAQGDDEVTVAVDDEVLVIDDMTSEEWWKVRRMKNGKQGVVPSSYVEITGTVQRASESVTGLNAARSTVEQNRLEEERLAKQATSRKSDGSAVPERGSSLAGEGRRSQNRGSASGPGDVRRQDPVAAAPSKSKPNFSRLRTWTDRSGTFKVEAEFIGLRNGKIHLHKTNGVKIAVPANKMAVEDLEYVENATGDSLDEDKPLSDIKRRNTQRKKEEDSRKQAAANGGSRAGAGASVQKVDGHDWFDFFLQCGVSPQICERYASAFSRDQMGPEVLPDVNQQLLRTLGLKEGDILRVMKFLDAKYKRSHSVTGPPLSPSQQQDDSIQPMNGGGGLFSGKDGTLKNNTSRKGRPAPPVQTNDVVDEAAFRPRGEEPSRREPPAESRATPLANAPARQPTSSTGFEDDAWDVKPARLQAMAAAQGQTFSAEPPRPAEPPRSVMQQLPKANDDLSLLAMPLQPAPTGAAAPPPPPLPIQQHAPPPMAAAPQQAQGADQALFDKIAALAPPRQRPQPPAISQIQQQAGTGLAPPPRAASAPGFNPQQSGGQFGPLALQPQLTGYQPQSQQQQMYPQQTGFGGQGLYAQPTGFMQSQQLPQISGVQAMQQNFPALQPQPTGMAFQPQSQFGQQQASQQYPSQQQGGFQQGQQPGFQQQPQQTGFQQQSQQPGFQQQPQPTGFGQGPAYQQAMVNGSQTGSPFADPPRQPFQAMPSGLQNQFAPQQTGFQPQQPLPFQSQPTGFMGAQQTNFQQQAPPGFQSQATGIQQQPTGVNGFGSQYTQQQPPPMPPMPQLPAQQTGGVFGPSQPIAAPLQVQKTGPPPPVRFGVQPVAKPLMAQATGRANLGRATPQNPFGF
ncbi:cytoskeletal protein binding protein [Friedmanniomyces endolithicus]|uniref:Actin cytoskeleton-regulatory complex protein SLA1 n=1 Tax=Friedmanniomyces endolithicus TaxID=329885 RepID=A0AAN6FBN3_9PEZI|nr:cytoskeletal protein binding protein [Friedmanniomyces endolithicus]